MRCVPQLAVRARLRGVRRALLGLAEDLYEELRLGYALVFRYLKRNYNSEVRARLDLLIKAIVAGEGRSGK